MAGCTTKFTIPYPDISGTSFVDSVWNAMTHAQKPDFVFRRNGRVHLNRQGAPVQSATGSRGLRISVSNAGYTTFQGSVKRTGYPLHSPVSPSLTLPCVTVSHHISTGFYYCLFVCLERPSRISEYKTLTITGNNVPFSEAVFRNVIRVYCTEIWIEASCWERAVVL
jgi:hypothetical protein